MLARITRWFLITAPVVAGVMVLIFGTAGSISTTFGVVLIGIGPTVWLWNWFVRMSFEQDREEERPERRREEAPERRPLPRAQSHQDRPPSPAHHSPRRPPRSRRRPP